MHKWLNKIIPKVLAGDRILQNNFFIALFLCAIPPSIAIGITVYSYSLFLSTYPSTWIPYWMLGEGLTILLMGNILSLYTPRHFKLYTQVLLISISSMIFAMLLLSQLPWYWAPFIAVLILRACSSISGVIIWGMVSTLFYHRQFKNIFNRFTISASVASLLSPLFYAWISHVFHLSSILVFLIILLMAGYFIINLTTRIATNPGEQLKKQQQSTSPFQFPLFRILLAVMLVISIVFQGIEFLMRNQLEMHFNQEEIATFISLFLLMTNTLALGMQVIAPQVFSKFKFYIILQGILIVIILGSSLYWFIPSLWPAVYLNGITLIFYYSWINLIYRSTNNIFPPAIKMKSDLILKSFAAPLGVIVAAILAFFSTRFTIILNFLPLIFIILLAFGIMLSYLLFRHYSNTLKEMITTTIFSFTGTKNLKELERLQNLILDTLQKPSIEPIEIALITPKIFETPPPELYQILKQNPHKEIQNTVVKVLNQYSIDVIDSKKLIALYRHNTTLTESARHSLSQLLSDIHSNVLLKDAKAKLVKEPTTKNALLILLKNGDTSDYIFAVNLTVELAQSADPQKRIIAAKLLYALGAGRFYDLKSQLLTDKEPSVRFCAFHHLPAQDVLNMLPVVGRFLNQNTIRILHQRFHLSELIDLSKQLVTLYQSHPQEYFLSAIAFITPLPDDILEQYVIEFLETKNSYYRNFIALKILERKKSITFSPKLQQQLIKALNFEIDLIEQYKILLNIPELQPATVILNNRIYHTRQRFLYWYAAYHQDTSQTASNINTINPYHVTGRNRNIQDKAIEFLLTNEDNVSIRTLIEKAFAEDAPHQSEHQTTDWKMILTDDDWLFQLLSQYPLEGNHDMNPLQRTIALQQTDFFESLQDEVLFELGQACEFLDCAPEQRIITEGEEGDSLYILIKGEVMVYKGEELLTTIKPFKCFGEMALFDENNKRTSTVIAKERTILLVLHKESFLAMTNEFPQILHNIIKIITKRYLGQIEMLENKLSLADSNQGIT